MRDGLPDARDSGRSGRSRISADLDSPDVRFDSGRTDDLGDCAVEDPMHVHDFHAAILHLLGLDHTRLTRTDQGRNFRLPDVGGIVADALLA